MREIGKGRRRGALASLEEASTELGHRGGMAKLAIYRISGNCTYPGCTFAISSGEFCKNHNPPKPEKSDKCRVCERVFRVNESVRGGVCCACYQKPEAKEARKKATAKMKKERGCSTPGCGGINQKGRDMILACMGGSANICSLNESLWCIIITSSTSQRGQ